MPRRVCSPWAEKCPSSCVVNTDLNGLTQYNAAPFLPNLALSWQKVPVDATEGWPHTTQSNPHFDSEVNPTSFSGASSHVSVLKIAANIQKLQESNKMWSVCTRYSYSSLLAKQFHSSSLNSVIDIQLWLLGRLYRLEWKTEVNRSLKSCAFLFSSLFVLLRPRR